MGNESFLSLSELNDRIAILRDNIRQLIEQAAGAAAPKSRSASPNGLNSRMRSWKGS